MPDLIQALAVFTSLFLLRPLKFFCTDMKINLVIILRKLYLIQFQRVAKRTSNLKPNLHSIKSNLIKTDSVQGSKHGTQTTPWWHDQVLSLSFGLCLSQASPNKLYVSDQIVVSEALNLPFHAWIKVFKKSYSKIKKTNLNFIWTSYNAIRAEVMLDLILKWPVFQKKSKNHVGQEI